MRGSVLRKQMRPVTEASDTMSRNPAQRRPQPALAWRPCGPAWCSTRTRLSSPSDAQELQPVRMHVRKHRLLFRAAAAPRGCSMHMLASARGIA